jgi:phage terminase small subunit
MSRGLTDKQSRFVEEYLIDLNATQAAIRAGYSASSADVNGSRMLGNAKVARAIAEKIEKRSQATSLTAEYVVNSLMEVAERCLQRRPVMVFDPVERSMVQATDDEGNHIWQFDSQGANRSLELLGKHLGMYTDKIRTSDETLESLCDFLRGE